MSTSSSIFGFEMIAPRFLLIFMAVSSLLAGCFFAVTLIVDPYGVSPIHLSMEHLNRFRPQRIDIDRLIKPYEVWRYQPKTIFMGSSRIQQGFDPSVMNRTRFAPAYNASIPASSISLNASYLQQYFDLDHNIETVIVELFFYPFLETHGSTFVEQQPSSRRTIVDFLYDTASLFISTNTLSATFQTLAYNLTMNAPIYEILPGGNFYYPPGHNSKGTFDGFPFGIWQLHAARPDLRLDESAYHAFHEIIELCRLHGVELIFVLTPNHVYDDYYIDAIGAWPVFEQWLRRISSEADILSFSQHNEWTYEPVKLHMTYWNDPYHFTGEMGAWIQSSLAGVTLDGPPINFKKRITQSGVHEYVTDHQEAVHRWMKDQSDFIERFAKERRKWELSKHGQMDDRKRETK